MRGGLTVGPTGVGAIAGAGVRPVPSLAVRPDALLYATIAIVLTAVWRLHDFVPAIAAMRPSIVLTGMGLLLLLLQRDLVRGLARLRSPVAGWLGVLVLLMLAGVPLSLDPDHSAQFFTNAILPFVLAGFLVAASVRGFDDLEWLALGLLAGGCVYTLVMHATRTVDASGRWTELGHYDVNDLALMLVAMFPLTLYFMRRGSSTFRRVFAAACFVLFAYSMVKTGSRGGLVGLIAVFAYLLIGYRAVPTRVRVVGAVVTAVLLVVGGQGYWGRVGTILRPSQDYNFLSETGRIAVWQRGLEYTKQRPLLGLGLDAFRTAERELSPTARRRLRAGRRPESLVAHNMLLHVAAELGLPALVAFIVLLGTAARTLMRVGRMHRDDSPDDAVPALGRALLASLIGFCVCGMFLSVAYFPYLPVLLGLTVALSAVARARWGTPRGTRRRSVFTSRGSYGLRGAAANSAAL
jgi:putative inorganic carbon (HCO3(-)) transporter